MNTLNQHTQNLKPKLKEKGWHVVLHDHYLGITGYKTKRDPTTGKKRKVPMEQHIISISECHIIDFSGEIMKNMWEVKTYLTTERNIFPQFETAWEMFLFEEQNRHPDDLNKRKK